MFLFRQGRVKQWKIGDVFFWGGGVQRAHGVVELRVEEQTFTLLLTSEEEGSKWVELGGS
jgi:hypothetical protein